VEATESRSCPLASFGIIYVESPDFVAMVLVVSYFVAKVLVVLFFGPAVTEMLVGNTECCISDRTLTAFESFGGISITR
jgi:hypothetical protein